VSQSTGPTRSARRAAPLVLALGIALVSGCSSDDAATGTTDAAPSSSAQTSSSAAAPTSTVPSSSAPAEAESETVSVTEGEMFIELSEDSLSAGTYTFEVTNTGRMPHDFVVELDGDDVAGTQVLQPGQSATLEVALDPGDYVFYCSVGAHRTAGMEFPVTVAA
jgi:plastocyanin